MSTQDVGDILARGRVMRHELLPSFNRTYLVELEGEGASSCRAIYKPRDGEAPLWDFPDRTLYKRERLAYQVSEALGWNMVPLTIIREGPHGIGVMQRFVQAWEGKHYFNLMPDRRGDMVRIAVFDCLVNNCDRKAGHCLLGEDGRVWAIDHGLTFPVGRKLRTVMWDLAREPLNDALKGDVAALRRNAELRSALESNLDPREVAAFYRRIDVALGSAVVPIEAMADPHRPLPWPAI